MIIANPTWRLTWIRSIIIHQTHYEKSDWSRAFNQFTIACELDMINVISVADITFIMSSSTSAWLLSPLECSPQKQNGWTLRFCFWGWIMWKMYMYMSCLCYLPQPTASADNTDLGFDNSWYHAQPHPIIVYWHPILSRVIDIIGQSFFASEFWRETKKSDFSCFILFFQNIFFGKVYFTAHRFKICKNKKFEPEAQI